MGSECATIDNMANKTNNCPTILITLSARGGIGKTLVTSNLSSLLTDMSCAHEIMSLEVHSRRLQHFHANATQIVLDESEIEKGGGKLDRVFLTPIDDRKHVLLDTGANTGRGLVSWLLSVNFTALCEAHKIRVVFLIVVGSGDTDSLVFFTALAELAGPLMDLYLVRSRHTGDDFELFEPLVKSVDANVIDLPVIPLRLIELSQQLAKPFPALAKDKTINVLQRQRCINIARQYEMAFKSLTERSFT